MCSLCRAADDNNDGTYCRDPAKIRRKYLRSWFLIDLLASIPFEYFGGNDQTLVLSMAKSPRLLRLSRLLKKLDMLTSARLMRFVSVLIIFVVFTHVVACFWWLVGVSMGPYGWQFQDDVVTLLLQDVDWATSAEHPVATTPLLVLANKIDLEPHISEAELIRELNLDYIVDNPWIVIPISALRVINIDQVVQWLIKQGKTNR